MMMVPQLLLVLPTICRPSLACTGLSVDWSTILRRSGSLQDLSYMTWLLTLDSSFWVLLLHCQRPRVTVSNAGHEFQEVGDENHASPRYHTDSCRAISLLNAKSRLLSLPPELRLRIFEYVFGTVRHHVKIKGDAKKYLVQLAHCEVELESDHHTYRKKTLEEIASSLQDQSDTSDHSRHTPCHRQWNFSGSRQPAKGHKRRLPQSLLLTCKAINEDAAPIMWHNHVFELELFSDDLEKFVNRMTAAQRKALRTIAFDVQATERGQVMTRRRADTPTDAASLLTWRQPMRNSYLALTGLQRVELFVDAWPGIEAITHFSFPGLGFDRTMLFGTFHMIGDWIRLLERQDVEDVDVRVEEGGVMGIGLAFKRTRPFPISAQQRLEYEGQVEVIVRGRALESTTEKLPLASGAENM